MAQFAEVQLDGMTIRTVALGPFATNCYIVRCDQTGKGAVVDAVGEFPRIVEMVEHDPAVELDQILQTHAHIDHVAALDDAKRKWDIPIVIHEAEMPLYQAAPMQGAMFGLRLDALPEPDKFVAEGDTVSVGNLTASVLHTPGHTPGGICFYFKDQSVVFSGDLLFAGSIGRTDLPGGDFPTIKSSLERMKTLPEETLVLSGHGPDTTIGREVRSNPFLRM